MDQNTTRTDADPSGFTSALDERTRLDNRRSKLGLPPLDQDAFGAAALALSGGGIRSATFSFGVMQALATSPLPGVIQAKMRVADPKKSPRPLLALFDYLSTVSGGGYIGAFFCSLFVPRRLRTDSDALGAASDAFKVCAYVPPARLRASDHLEMSSIGKCPTAWLRENGRYLTPTGAGDGLYAAATALRNWLAIHYVLGTLFLCAFSVLALTRAGLASLFAWYAEFECTVLALATRTYAWWSPVWGLVLATLVLWLAPCGTAFWLAYPRKDESEEHCPRFLGAPACADLTVAIVLLIAFAVIPSFPGAPKRWDAVLLVPAVVGLIALIAFVMHFWIVRGAQSIADSRVRITRWGAVGIGWLIGLLVVAITDTLGESIYLGFFVDQSTSTWKPWTPAALLGATAWGVRQLAKLTDETSKSTSKLKKLPIDVIAGVVGSFMLLCVGSAWSILVQYFKWRGLQPNPVQFADPSHVGNLLFLFVITLLMAAFAGRFIGFINLSTFQAVYGARLTRAYLGASNGERFRKFKGDDRDLRRSSRSVAEPLRSDQLSLKDYYRDSLAPLHIVNATVNQTIDPSEQLVQRDRKGRPLAILPGGFTIDGTFYTFSQHTGALWTLGQWVGISGAAFTTGLGRATTVGTSLALGLANVRLGLWWECGYGIAGARGLEWLFGKCFRVHLYLIYELLARFHGLRRQWQYLSDGGHFENTGVYELLRPGRNVRFVIACDNGCDPTYHFSDLANLIRLVRIDFQREIEVDLAITERPELKEVFGTLEDFRPKKKGSTEPKTSSDKCAILLKVFDSADGMAGQIPIAYVVILKPTVIRGASVDITEYHSTHPDFPQQTTANQFFDEAQWESYRDLGFRMAKRVFGRTEDGGFGPVFWKYLQSLPLKDSR